MDGKRFLRSIRLRNILSFGPDTPELPLEPLNVLIGPNASGKSNLIQALSLLSATSGDLEAPILEGGGVREWLWKGVEEPGLATLDVTVEYPRGDMPLRYRLSFGVAGVHFRLQDELIEDEKARHGNEDPDSYYRYMKGRSLINIFDKSRKKTSYVRDNLKHGQSVLSQIRDPEMYRELTHLDYGFGYMSFYRDSNFGRFTPARQPQRSDLAGFPLLEDASNLGVALSYLLGKPPTKQKILKCMKTFYPMLEDIVVSIVGGPVQIFFHEAGLQHPVPATRLSDGSLRYLCLLAVLCHADRLSVICIEEPELGLHPDMIPEVAKLLVEASSRTQLFVTTHSDILVDALSDTPEAIIVCEKSEGVTQLQRLNAEELKPWLEKYRLGEIWTSGHIGGNRW